MGKFAGPKPSPALAVAIVALVAALSGCLIGLAACGGTLSKDEYAERVDETCANMSDDLERLDPQGAKAIEERDFQAAGDVYDEMHAVVEKTLDSIESIPVPEGEEEAVSDFLRAQRVQAAALGRVGEAMRSENPTVIDDTLTQITEARQMDPTVETRTGFSC